MAWSWSHTNEGIAAVQENLENLPREDREIMFAEWRAAQVRGTTELSHHFDNRRYERALKFVKTLPDDSLNEFLWEKTQEFATCSNGGWDAYCCPFGCGCHQVPFSLPADTQEEAFYAFI